MLICVSRFLSIHHPWCWKWALKKKPSRLSALQIISSCLEIWEHRQIYCASARYPVFTPQCILIAVWFSFSVYHRWLRPQKGKKLSLRSTKTTSCARISLLVTQVNTSVFHLMDVKKNKAFMTITSIKIGWCTVISTWLPKVRKKYAIKNCVWTFPSWPVRQSSHTIIARGVISGKDTGRVVQWWSPTGPVDLLCLGPNDLLGCSIIVRNNLRTEDRNMTLKMLKLRNV